MTARRVTTASLAALCALALLAAGCGGSADDSSTATASSSSTAGAGGTATIDVADNATLGPILTDAGGNTVYLFEKDESGSSECSGSCATAWPPVIAKGKPTAGEGADASLLSTVTRDDGSEQVTYDGHPLYLYQGDVQPGDTSGNGLDQFGAEWYALTPDGSNAEGTESGGESTSGSEDSTDSTSGSAGYGY